MSKINIAVVGGGIAGLALAAGLAKKLHLSVHVYEAVGEYLDVGAGLALHRNAIRAMALLGPEHKDELVAKLGRAKGRKSGPKIQLKFVTGMSTFADCLLGADGVPSVTRSYLLGPDHPATGPKNHGEEARKQINPTWKTSVPILPGPSGHINCTPLNRNTRLSAGVAVRDDHDHAPFYSCNNVAMLGDAAHASLPFAGNGAAQALEDAAVLNYIVTAQQAFRQVRRPRSQSVVDLARKLGRVYAFAEDGMHGDPMRTKAFFAEMAAFTNDFDVESQNHEALGPFRQSLEGDVDARVWSPPVLSN
ncbi:hypothetical protein F5B22DRAFT_633666 [Xylaria bambusicola]|uniref:uncharacterized protein n=1 Tax=Xylaria bambusicola TaxID=326684 RepID=UPI00200741AA|nr:uncharacterized protein F5B22DRAFT_633666 [Xylaria bambusicola]KAI0525583.1 hypothetical protein F5B22DRAFT_633666 [Xylaria bambusicola]